MASVQNYRIRPPSDIFTSTSHLIIPEEDPPRKMFKVRSPGQETWSAVGDVWKVGGAGVGPGVYSCGEFGRVAGAPGRDVAST